MLEEGNSSWSFYVATRNLASAAAAPQWGMRDLFPGKDPKQVCWEGSILSTYISFATAISSWRRTSVALQASHFPDFLYYNLIFFFQSFLILWEIQGSSLERFLILTKG